MVQRRSALSWAAFCLSPLTLFDRVAIQKSKKSANIFMLSEVEAWCFWAS